MKRTMIFAAVAALAAAGSIQPDNRSEVKTSKAVVDFGSVDAEGLHPISNFFANTLPNWFNGPVKDWFEGPVKDAIGTYQNGIDTVTDTVGDWFSGPVKDFFEGPVKDVAEDAGNWFKNLWLGPEATDERYLEEQKEKERQRLEQLRIETELARAEWEKQKDEEASWEYRPGQTIILDPGLR